MPELLLVPVLRFEQPRSPGHDLRPASSGTWWTGIMGAWERYAERNGDSEDESCRGTREQTRRQRQPEM